MKRILLSTVFIVMVIFVTTQANAKCRWEFVCDEDGRCKQKPICDSTLDIPSPEPPRIEPIVPPAIKPIQPPTVPPIGTTECKKVRLCDSFGNCRWETVCD